MSSFYFVRAGKSARFIDEFIEQSLVGIGFESCGVDERALQFDRSDVVDQIKKANPDWSTFKAASPAGQVYRFIHELKVGDGILTYDANQRLYSIGRIVGSAMFDRNKIEGLQFLRQVKWEFQASRDVLSRTTKHQLGSISTLFEVNESAWQELNDKKGRSPEFSISLPVVNEEDIEESVAISHASALQTASELIEDRIVKLGPSQVEHLTAGILRAMGYVARVSPTGSDRAVDVFASPDGLGLEEPRIFVEVKHHRGKAMGSKEIRSFMGGRQVGDKCLFVSTGGFTKDARYEAERSSIPLTLLTLQELRELLVAHYENADNELRTLVPMSKVYWPTPREPTVDEG